MFNGAIRAYGSSETGVRNRTQIWRDVDGGGYSANYPSTQDITFGSGGFDAGTGVGFYWWISMSFLDSPSSDAEVTYKMYIRKDVATGSGDNTSLGGSSLVMSAIAMEIDDA